MVGDLNTIYMVTLLIKNAEEIEWKTKPNRKMNFKQREMFVTLLFNCIKLKTVHYKKKQQQQQQHNHNKEYELIS